MYGYRLNSLSRGKALDTSSFQHLLKTSSTASYSSTCSSVKVKVTIAVHFGNVTNKCAC